jgi:GT2 family glycosyltransferase
VTPPSLDVIVVNWNGGSHLRACIESVHAADREEIDLRRIVVVDNASTDGSLESLPPEGSRITLIRNATNRGFATACNQGAHATAADYLLFLNPDTQLRGNSLVEPIRFCEQPANRAVGIVGIQLLDQEGKVVPTCARFPSAGRFLAAMFGLDRLFPSLYPAHFMTEWDHADTRAVDQVMGAVFLVRRKVFENLNGFDERFFVYFEEVDFSLRARQNGWLTYFVSSAQAFHRGGGSTEGARSTRLFYSLRSRLIYAGKHFGGLQAIVVTLATLFVEPFTRLAIAAARRSAVQAADTIIGYARLWFALLTGRMRSPRTRA